MRQVKENLRFVLLNDNLFYDTIPEDIHYETTLKECVMLGCPEGIKYKINRRSYEYKMERAKGSP